GPPPAGPNHLDPDLRPMKELLQAPTDGVGDAIIVPPVLASQFELKIGLLNLVTANSFHRFENDDPHSHIRRFNQDSLNSAAGGNLLTRNTQEALTIIENKSKVRTSRNKPQVSSASGSSSRNDSIIALTKQVEALAPNQSSTDDLLRQLLIQNQNLKRDQEATNQLVQNQIGQLTKALQERPQVTLPSNIVANPQEEIKVITPYSGITLAGPSVPPPPLSSSKEVERDPETTMDQVHISS
ncbi:hypothetical protein Tco_1470977, partial [Tanacetum coccineum]